MCAHLHAAAALCAIDSVKDSHVLLGCNILLQGAGNLCFLHSSSHHSSLRYFCRLDFCCDIEAHSRSILFARGLRVVVFGALNDKTRTVHFMFVLRMTSCSIKLAHFMEYRWLLCVLSSAWLPVVCVAYGNNTHELFMFSIYASKEVLGLRCNATRSFGCARWS